MNIRWRIYAALCVFCFLCCFLPAPANATNNTYYLEDLGMSVKIPVGLVAFTRDMDANDPNLAVYGLNKDDFLNLMYDRNIYLNAWDQDLNYEIVVTMIDSPLEDYNQYSDTSLNAFVSGIKTEYEGIGVTCLKSEIYQHDQAKFVTLYISQPSNGSTAYGLQYNTVYAGKAINITLHSYTGTIGSYEEIICKAIVQSVRFDTEPTFAEPLPETPAFVFTDKETGVKFTVPENWVESPMNEEREHLDAKFESNSEAGAIILYASQDIWEPTPGLTRKSLNNSSFSKADVAEAFGCKETDVKIVKFGDYEYYRFGITATETKYGLTVSIPMTVCVRVENGYLFMFQFSGGVDHANYKDLEALLNSAEYPDETLPTSTENPTTKEQMSFGSISTLCFLALIGLAIVSYIYFKKKSAKTKARMTSAPPCMGDPIEPLDETEPHEQTALNQIVCKTCGQALPADSVFCHYCGTRI